MGRVVEDRVDGKAVKIQFVAKKVPEGADAIVRPWGKKYLIYVDPDLGGRKRLEAIIHELLHVSDWDKEERWVESVAYDIARILDLLGYRADV